MMADIFQAFLTALAGITVFVIGQIFLKLFIDPIDDLRKKIRDIADVLIHNDWMITSSAPPLPETLYQADEDSELIKAWRRAMGKREELEKLLLQELSLLKSKAYMVYWHWLFERLRMIPERSSIDLACENIELLCEYFFSVDIDEDEQVSLRNEVFDLLNIKRFQPKNKEG